MYRHFYDKNVLHVHTVDTRLLSPSPPPPSEGLGTRLMPRHSLGARRSRLTKKAALDGPSSNETLLFRGKSSSNGFVVGSSYH